MKRKSKVITSGLKSQFKPFLLRSILTIIGLSLMGWLAFFWNLGKTGLVDETEPLFAEAARQMLVSGDWITPYFNEVPRFDKPPLIYWLMVLAYQVVGVNEWGVRLPSAIAAFFLTLFCFYILQFYVQNIKTSSQSYPGLIPQNSFRFHPLPWMGAALITFNPEMITWARIGVSDMLLNACMGSALFAFFRGYAEPQPNQKQNISPWYLVFYLFLALAVLSKGPVGFVLPILIIGLFTVYVGNLQKVCREIHPVLGGTIFASVVLPWYIWVTAQHGSIYINTFFGYHNLQRFTQVVNNHAAPWYFYFIVVLVGFLPWSIYLPAAIFKTHFWQRKYWQERDRIQQLPLFSLSWFGCIFLFFTISVTKLPSYILPSMPAASCLVAFLWNNIAQSKNRSIVHGQWKSQSQFINFVLALNILFLLVISLLIFLSVHWIGYDPDMPKFKATLQASGLIEYSSLIWGLTAIFALFYLWRKQLIKIFVVNLIGFILFLSFAITPAHQLFDLHRQQPLRQLAETINKERIFQEELVMISFNKPSLVFYTRNPVQYFQYYNDAINSLRSSLIQSQQPDTILIVSDSQTVTEITRQVSQYQKLDQQGTYHLIRVSKLALLNTNKN